MSRVELRRRTLRHATMLKLLRSYFACFLTFAHRFFAALIIAALPAADKTRFFASIASLSTEGSSGDKKDRKHGV
jgi:hypothetical protein